jgi:diguanylate cyclase
VLGWLGRRSSDRVDSSQANGGTPVFEQARRDLLDEITSFLLRHRLEVTPDNLAIAHGAFSGSNPGLARQIAQRVRAGLDITQEWLDEAAATEADKNRDDGVETLLTKLESLLDTYSRNTSVAGDTTAEYNEKLETHVAELTQAENAGQLISDLAELAKAMLERSRQLEADMRKSEGEAKSLRRSLAKAKRDAEVDHLTGLPNRRAFESVLESEYREARAAVEPLVVAFCDIDHFKRINDAHGHDVGDRVLKVIAESLSAASDDKCHVARHGGEEFVMLFRGATATQAKARLDEIRERLSERKLVSRTTDEPIGQVTFSAGLADVFDFADPRAALKAADDALYAAKEGGRNQVFVAERAG